MNVSDSFMLGGNTETLEVYCVLTCSSEFVGVSRRCQSGVVANTKFLVQVNSART